MAQKYKVKQHKVEAIQWTGKNLREIQRFTQWIAEKQGKVLYLRLPHMDEFCLTGGWIVKLGASITVLGPGEFEEKYEKEA